MVTKKSILDEQLESTNKLREIAYEMGTPIQFIIEGGPFKIINGISIKGKNFVMYVEQDIYVNKDSSTRVEVKFVTERLEKIMILE